MTVVTIPRLETERFVMRAPIAADFEPYVAFCASPRAAGVGGPFTRREAFDRLAAVIGHWSLRGYGRWIVAERGSDRPLGVVGLFYPEGWPEPEIAWSLFAEAEGRGIAHETALATRSYAYDVLGWSTVVSCMVPDNLRSIALARRMGAVQEGNHFHPDTGEMLVWRHLPPDQLADGGIEAYA